MWTDKYAIYGTKQVFHLGDGTFSSQLILTRDTHSPPHDFIVVDTGSYKPLAIDFGQTYKLVDWNTPATVVDGSVRNKLGFRNHVLATAVVCLDTPDLGGRVWCVQWTCS